jgi:hypothetical protein
MYELIYRVVAHAARMQAQSRIAQGRRSNARNADIDRFRQHVLAVLRNARAR